MQPSTSFIKKNTNLATLMLDILDLIIIVGLPTWGFLAGYAVGRTTKMRKHMREHRKMLDTLGSAYHRGFIKGKSSKQVEGSVDA